MKTNLILKLEEHHEPSKDGTPVSDVIWVNVFDEANAKTFCENVLKASAKDKHQPVIVYIDSYGGAVDALAAMISVLDSIPNQVITACTGKAMSCGAILLSHGDLRLVAPHGRVMIHEVSSAAWGNINDVKTDANESMRLNKYYMDLLAKNCGLDNAKQLPFTNERRDVYMSAQEALKFGIVDKIGTPRVEKVIRFDVHLNK